MKYIKTYEIITSYSDYKKYIIIKIIDEYMQHKTKDLLVLQVIKINPDKDRIYYIQHYHYNIKDKTLYTDSTIYSRKQILYNVKETFDVLYTSDDLKECVKMLPFLTDINKYNI
jgi:hypothetical protein